MALSICGEVERSGQRHCEQLRLEARALQVPGDPAPPSPETGPRKRPGGFDKGVQTQGLRRGAGARAALACVWLTWLGDHLGRLAL